VGQILFDERVQLFRVARLNQAQLRVVVNPVAEHERHRPLVRLASGLARAPR
jgi:hypothetical protein